MSRIKISQCSYNSITFQIYDWLLDRSNNYYAKLKSDFIPLKKLPSVRKLSIK